MTIYAMEKTETQGPEWETRPWGKPSLYAPFNHPNKNLLASCEFKYYGLKIRGVRVMQGDNKTYVKLPNKQFGDRLDDVFYFLDGSEREQFVEDVLWLYQNTVGKWKMEREAGVR